MRGIAFVVPLFLALGGSVLAQGLVPHPLGAPGSSDANHPNVLLIVADDVGVDRVAAYGEHPDPGHTPVIDGLAEAGVLFRNAWSNPACSATRATILTGRYSFRTGIGRAITYSTPGFDLSPDQPSLPRILRAGIPTFEVSEDWGAAAGGGHHPARPTYHTAMVGKWHLATINGGGLVHPLLMGFDHHRGPIENLPDADGEQAYFQFEKAIDGVPIWCTTYATTDQVNDTLKIARVMPEPWFLSLAFNGAHGPFHKPPASLHSCALPPNVVDDVPLHHQAMVEAMDTEIGRLLAGMSPEVLARTVIIFVGDNGTPQAATTPPFVSKHAKGSTFEGGINVPLIVAGPGVVAGAECAALVNTTDLFATILEVAGVPGPGNADSVSLVPYFAQPDRPPLRSWVLAEYFAPNGWPPYANQNRAIREERYKLSHRLLADGGIEARFYDLELDPFERHELLAAGPLTLEQKLALRFLKETLAGLE